MFAVGCVATKPQTGVGSEGVPEGWCVHAGAPGPAACAAGFVMQCGSGSAMHVDEPDDAS
jgi:hypothetical protein